MIANEHVSIDGELYQLAQDADGTHYDQAGEPLRPPNAMPVQGEQGKFQVRPDLLLWRITDWSGGEGQIKYDSGAPNKHFELTNVDPFTEPGKLFPAPAFGITTSSAAQGGGAFSATCQLVRAAGKLIAFMMGNTTAYIWDELDGWGVARTITAAAAKGPKGTVHGDGSHAWFIEQGTGTIIKFDSSYNSYVVDTGTISVNCKDVAGLGPYIYTINPYTGQVWEILKSSGAVTSIDEPALALAYSNSSKVPSSPIVPGDNRLYTYTVTSGDTIIREITPTSAAGPGFGAQIARLDGFEANAMWWAGGILYLAGSNRLESGEEVILYLQPGQSFGSLGHIRRGQNTGLMSAGENNNAMLVHGFVSQWNDGKSQSTSRYTGLHLIDTVTGGRCLYCATDASGQAQDPSGPIEYNGRWFWSHTEGINQAVYWTDPDEVAQDGYATTPMHDFDLADEKVLSSVRVVLEDDMPTDWEIKVYYGLDTDTPDTLGLTMDDTDGHEASAAITTAATPVVFNHLSVRIEFVWAGGGTPGNTKPKLLQVEVRAQLAEVPKRWRLLLDCRDQKSAGQKSYNGAKKLSLLRTAIAKKTVALIDGYYSHDPKENTTYDVVVDTYRFVLTRPGEGYAYLELVEVL